VIRLHNIFLNAWYPQKNNWHAKWVYLFLPLSWLFRSLAFLRKTFFIFFAQQKINVPIVIVGNISVGGTGKTPLIIALVQHLQAQGYKPGVISRGYGGKAAHYPFCVDENTEAEVSGDEPLLIFNATHCHVCIAPDRVAAARLLAAQGCTIILSDDGLQHYGLGRDIEIVVVDGLRLFGNRQLLPVGPLREPIDRLKTVDLVIVNDSQNTSVVIDNVKYFHMHMKPVTWRKILADENHSHLILPLDAIKPEQKLHAVAGIGNPQRFFNTLTELSLNFNAHVFSDHHPFSSNDFVFAQDDVVVMTEKDAVKCKHFAKKNWYALMVKAQLDEAFLKAFDDKLKNKKLKTLQGSTS
jgi:tetraacyldisaccharide 4'-kinase